MEQKLNTEALLEYSRAFAKRLNDYYFIDHNYIQGKEVLSFSEIKQVNLFIVKIIFEKWKDEMKKLKSPYFNYTHPTVSEALDNFMNILSQHIHIQKNDFYPLLVEATYDTLLLVLEPSQYFLHEFKKVSNHTVNLTRLKDIAKYLTINKGLMGVLIEKMRERNVEELHNKEMRQLFSEVYEENKNYIEPMEFRVKAFSDIHSLDLDKLYSNPQTSTNEMIFAENSEPKVPIYETTKLEEDNNVHKTYQKEESNVLGQYQQSKIDNLRNSISLNQKFIFINQLFNGNNLAYTEAIDDVEGSNTLKEAMDLIESKYAVPYHWQEDENEEVAHFYQLIRRKF